MSVYTVSGLAASDVGDTGIYEMTDGQPVISDPWNKTLKDLQIPSRYALLPGVLEPPGLLDSISASGLDITFASGTTWYAQQVYTLSPEFVLTVADDAESVIYGRSDGVISTDITGFLASQYCILCTVHAADGVAVIDFTTQQRARYAAPDFRFCMDTGAVSSLPREIDANAVMVIPDNAQMIFYPPSETEPFECNGYLILNGRAKTEAW